MSALTTPTVNQKQPGDRRVCDPIGSGDPTAEGILQLGLGFWASKTLLSAVELGVFTELGNGPMPAETLIQRLDLHPRAARDFLDALVAIGMLERERGIYANTSATNLFLDRTKGTYVGGMLEMANSRLYPFWAHLTEALKTGLPQNEIKHGGNFFAEVYADKESLANFLKAMTSLSISSGSAIARLFPWEKYQSFADIGTAQGGLPVQIALARPHLRGVGFDLPPVQPHFDAYIEQHGLSNRINFQGGNFFNDPLPTADVLIMGHVLHDWGFPEKRALIEKAYSALPTGGALIVYEAIIDDERRQNAFGLLMSLNMLIETPAGADYTAAVCSDWMRQAGFKATRSEHLSGPESMVVGLK
jgi:O-methyltransferase domain/Dimerisation domain